MTVVLSRDVVCLRLVCHEPDGSTCRRACTEGCDDFCSDADGHIKPVSFCTAVEWMTEGGDAEECYAGDDEIPLHDGMPVEISWNGDYYEWSVAKDECSEN